MSGRPPRRACGLTPLALALALALTAACGQGPDPTRDLAPAVAASAAADAALARGDRAAARGALDRELELLEGPGARGLQADDRRALVQDALARRARIALDEGRPAEAEAFADRGLALGGDDLFRASLLVARGAARAARGEARAAAADLHEALLLDERLLERALDEPRAPGPVNRSNLAVEAPGWQGATREPTHRYMTEEQRRHPGWTGRENERAIGPGALTPPAAADATQDRGAP